MKIDYAKVNDVTGVITMNIEESDYADSVKKQLKEIGKKHAEPGFRPGHVPAALIAKKYGKGVKYDEINKLVGDAIFDYIKENNINVLGNPVPDPANAINDDATDFTFKFTVGVAPEMNLKADKDVHIPYYTIDVTDEMIDRQDEALRRRYGKQEPGDEVDATALVKGVITELNEDGTVKEDGVVVENGIVAPQYFKSDDQRQLFIGKHVDDSLVFNPAATCDSNPTELASMLNLDKEAAENHKGDFRFDIKEIIVLKPAELGEEYYKEVFGEEVKDEAGYREAVKKLISDSLVNDQNFRFTMDAENVFRAQVGDIELPDEILKDFLISRNEGLNKDNIDEEYGQIRSRLVWDLEKNQLMEMLGVKVTGEDMKATARMLAAQQFAQYGMANPPEDAIEHYAGELLKEEKYNTQIAQQTADMKLFSAIKEVVTVDDKTVSIDEFNKLFANEAEVENA